MTFRSASRGVLLVVAVCLGLSAQGAFGQQGPCCFGGGGCTITNVEICTAEGGEFLGETASCEDCGGGNGNENGNGNANENGNGNGNENGNSNDNTGDGNENGNLNENDNGEGGGGGPFADLQALICENCGACGDCGPLAAAAYLPGMVVLSRLRRRRR